jgi:Fic family protein
MNAAGTGRQTIVCEAWQNCVMANGRRSISVTLSPAQIDEVVRAAAPGGTMGFAALISVVLERLHRDGQQPGEPLTDDRLTSAARYFPAFDDRRLSRSLLRGLAILTCFGADGEPLGIVDIATQLQLSPSTAYRYVLTLVEVGLLEQCPKTRKYRLPAW